jgi:glucose-6-phosphate 1-epimerase
MHNVITAENGFRTLEIANDAATAKIALQGAQVFDYARTGEPGLLWTSPSAFFENGRKLRGGIPVCWPWFGTDTERPERPQHGFVRTALWTLASVEESDPGLTVVTLTLDHTQVEQSFWPFDFRLTLRVSVSNMLTVSLTTENLGTLSFEITEALHTYLSVGDVTAVHLVGLEGTTYADATDGFMLKSSSQHLAVTRETDRVYLDTDAIVTVRDDRLERSIIVDKTGSYSTVVWNPWIAKAKTMKDFPDNGYESMICVETANALKNDVLIEPGASHTISQTLR